MTSNHGTFYYNQLVALQILVGELESAKASVRRYFGGQFLSQIDADGEQVSSVRHARTYTECIAAAQRSKAYSPIPL